MSEFISGKEALIALANSEEVIYINTYYKDKPLKLWGDAKECNIEQFLSGDWIFRLKHRTITINGIKVPAPFEPKDGEDYWYIVDSECGCSRAINTPNLRVDVAAWRTKEEIKQVVAALRSVFKGEQNAS